MAPMICFALGMPRRLAVGERQTCHADRAYMGSFIERKGVGEKKGERKTKRDSSCFQKARDFKKTSDSKKGIEYKEKRRRIMERTHKKGQGETSRNSTNSTEATRVSRI